MSGFVLERLFPTGWRRTGELYWRYKDAIHEATRSIREDGARSVRILSVRIGDEVEQVNATELELAENNGGQS
jgi:hypothetical protein